MAAGYEACAEGSGCGRFSVSDRRNGRSRKCGVARRGRSGAGWGGGPREARNLQSRATSPAAEWLAAGSRGHGGLACRRVVRGWSWEAGRGKHATCKVALLRLRRNGWRLAPPRPRWACLPKRLFVGGLGRRAARSTQLAKSRYFACGGMAGGWPPRPRWGHLLTLNRNSMTSPSFTTYSLPSMRSLPASLAACLEPRATRSS